MNIGEAASACGLSAKTIRHYEGIGLVPPPLRSEAGYRRYGEHEVQVLRFVRHARDLGFPLEQVRALLGLWTDRTRPSRDVKALAEAHLRDIEAKLRELQAVRASLHALIDGCHGDSRPECPILDSLAEAPATTPSPHTSR